MKKRILSAICCIAAMLLGTGLLKAQKPALQARATIASVEDETSQYEVFPLIMPDGSKQYYLSLGNVFVGDHKIGVDVPVAELFVYLGANLNETLSTMEEIKTWFKEPVDTEHHVGGRLAIGQPDGTLEEIEVETSKGLFGGKYLEFEVERSGADLYATIGKANFSSLVSGVKFYRKLHPKE